MLELVSLLHDWGFWAILALPTAGLIFVGRLWIKAQERYLTLALESLDAIRAQTDAMHRLNEIVKAALSAKGGGVDGDNCEAIAHAWAEMAEMAGKIHPA